LETRELTVAGDLALVLLRTRILQSNIRDRVDEEERKAILAGKQDCCDEEQPL